MSLKFCPTILLLRQCNSPYHNQLLLLILHPLCFHIVALLFQIRNQKKLQHMFIAFFSII